MTFFFSDYFVQCFLYMTKETRTLKNIQFTYLIGNCYRIEMRN